MLKISTLNHAVKSQSVTSPNFNFFSGQEEGGSNRICGRAELKISYICRLISDKSRWLFCLDLLYASIEKVDL